MDWKTLEKYQALIYLAAAIAGLGLGQRLDFHTGPGQTLLWPLLGVLLYTTFVQVRLGSLGRAFGDIRFTATAVAGNFLVIPLVVFALLWLVPADPAVRLGVAMVLLVPCTDWFISFTQLGRGDTGKAIAFTPLSLLLQVALLPVYLAVLLGTEVATGLVRVELLWAFVLLILLPFFMALVTQRWAVRSFGRARRLRELAWLPIPLLAMVVFLVAATQSGTLMESGRIVWQVVGVFVAFLAFAALLARLLASLTGMPAEQGRVLAFSFGSRNSFVVLPVALALPASMELAMVVIVLQSLVELFGMIAFVWLVPNWLFPDRTAP